MDSVMEVLQLVAEHARELTSASYASASWTAAADEEVRVTASDPEATETIEPRVMEDL